MPVSKPRIGIAEIGYDFIGILLKKQFEKCITRAGGEAVWILNGKGDKKADFESIAGELDGFLFPGGSDVNPALYGQKPSPQCGKLNSLRDKLEPPMIEAALKLDKPVLGICRGFQLINAVLGGSLLQDLKTEAPASSAIHTRMLSFLKPVHSVKILSGSLLARSTGSEQLNVNSAHHQTISILSDSLTASAVSEDGIIEGVESSGFRFLAGIQWHPEVLTGRYAIHQNIFNAFVTAAK